jgi:hypothetical protein
MIRSVVMTALVLAIGLTVAPRSAVAASPVIQVVTVEVKPGMLDQYRQELKKVQGVMTRLGSKASMRVWNTTAGGPNSGQVLVGLEYPDQATWATDSPKMQADAEWQKIQAGLANVRTVVGNSIWRDVSPVVSKGMAGSTLVLTAVAVKPGKQDDYLKRIASLNAVSDRLGLKGRTRVWNAVLAGPAAGSIAVGAEYPDLASYVSEQDKLTADAEWTKTLAGLDEVRTLTGRSLYQEITP